MPSLNKFRLRLVNLIDSNLNKIEKKALGGFYKIAYISVLFFKNETLYVI